MSPIRPLLGISFVLATAASGSAQSFGGTKVVETGVNYPGIGTFSSFVVRPSISGTNVAFGGNLSTGAPALALDSAGTRTAIAVVGSTPVPSGTGNFTAFNASPIGLSGSVYTFAGNGNPGPTNAGAYSNVTGTLTPVVNLGMPYPGGGTFTNFSAAAVSGTTFTFSGTNFAGGPPTGVFTRNGTNTPLPVASTSTPMPSGAGNFASFYDPALGQNGVYLPNISGANVVFGGRNSAGTSFGLFLTNAFGLATVATNATAIPNGSGLFTSFGTTPAISGSNVAFYGTGSGQAGIYRWSGGAPVLVADLNTSVPGGTGRFTSFGQQPFQSEVAISGTHVAFRGTSSGGSGIYTDLTGTPTKVIATGDLLDGKTVDGVDIGQFAFDGNTIAVMVSFTNNTDGVYTFTPVPEPTGLLALGVAGFLAMRFRKRR